MQNDFEKEVRQKMDELKFVPTEPVWSKIEAQIRTRKDRRRLIFWLPLFLLVLLAGGWLLIKQLAPQDKGNNSSNNGQVVQEGGSLHQRSGSIVKNDVPGNAGSKEKDQIERAIAPGLSNNQNRLPVVTEPAEESNLTRSEINNTVNNTPGRKQKTQAANSNTNSITVIAAAQQPINNRNGQMRSKPESTLPVESRLPGHLLITPERINFANVVERSMPETSEPSEAAADSAAVQPAVVQTAKPKWKLAILLQGGISGVGEGFLFSRADMTPAFATPPPVTNADIRPSIQSEGMHLAAGIAVKRSISKRLEFQTGLQYSYYSHKLLVAKDSFVGIPSGGVTTPQQVRTQPHTNRFHFIAMPVELQWQLLKQVPLHLNGGVTVQQLLNTNALVYKGPGNRYTSGDESIRKTQLMAGIGINYAFRLKKGSLQVGPQLQYAMTSFEKGRNNRQLYALGLKTQFNF